MESKAIATKGSRKKNPPLMARPLRGEGEVNDASLLEELFLRTIFKMTIKLGGGGKALMAWPLVEDFFCGLPIDERVRHEIAVLP